MRRVLTILFGGTLVLAAAPARAQFPGDVPDTFRISLGANYDWFKTQVQFTQFATGSLPGVNVDLENFTGLPDSKVGPNVDGWWNFAGRSYIDFAYLSFDRSHSATIARDFVFGDAVYQAGATVATSMKSSFPYVGYRYGFIKTDSMQLGLSLGVTYASMEAELSGSAGIVTPGGPVGAAVSKDAKVHAWVPLIGVQFETKIVDCLTAGLNVRGAGATITPYHGWTVGGLAHADYYFAHNFGVGLGYQYTKYSIRRSNATQSIEFNYQFDGPQAYFTLTF